MINYNGGTAKNIDKGFSVRLHIWYVGVMTTEMREEESYGYQIRPAEGATPSLVALVDILPTYGGS